MRRYVSPVAKIPANSPIGTANPKIVAAFKGEAMQTSKELMAKNKDLEEEVKKLKAKFAEQDADLSRL